MVVTVVGGDIGDGVRGDVGIGSGARSWVKGDGGGGVGGRV